MPAGALISSLLTTGMHRIERRVRKRRVIRLSAPRSSVSPIPGSMLPGSPQPALPHGAVCSCRPFAPPQQRRLSTPPFQDRCSRPATSQLRLQTSSPVRPFRSTTALPGLPRSRPASLLQTRCVSAFTRLQLAFTTSTPRPGCYPRLD